MNTDALAEVFDVFSARPRVHVLQCLATHDGPTEFDELAGAIARQEHDVSSSEISEMETERIKRALYHIHMPRLVEAELIEIEEACDNILVRTRTEQVRAYRDLLEEQV